MDFKTIGVIGAGVMGNGVSQNLAQTDYKVVLLDISNEKLIRSKEEIYQNIRIQNMFGKAIKKNNPDTIMGNIQFTNNYDDLSKVDYIIENVIENYDTKYEVYKKIDNICLPEVIFAVNTSAVSITRIASNTQRQDKIIGMHFMNPVPLKKFVEVIKGEKTSVETTERSGVLLKSMGKDYVVINDFPGFVSNRLSHLFMNEAAFLVQENVGTPEDIDRVFKEGYGHKMGPLETADLIGLDTVVNTLKVLYDDYQDSKFRCCPLLRKMVDAGYCGKKSGKGFYSYFDD